MNQDHCQITQFCLLEKAGYSRLLSSSRQWFAWVTQSSFHTELRFAMGFAMGFAGVKARCLQFFPIPRKWLENTKEQAEDQGPAKPQQSRRHEHRCYGNLDTSMISPKIGNRNPQTLRQFVSLWMIYLYLPFTPIVIFHGYVKLLITIQDNCKNETNFRGGWNVGTVFTQMSMSLESHILSIQQTLFPQVS